MQLTCTYESENAQEKISIVSHRTIIENINYYAYLYAHVRAISIDRHIVRKVLHVLLIINSGLPI